jgi:RNA processing factor Prp31
MCQSLAPGKHAIAAGKDFEQYRPQETHPLTEEIKRRSRKLADASKQRRFNRAATRPPPCP